MTNPTTRIDGQILSMRRLFDEPPAAVFAAFTEPDQLDRWWGPDGYTTTTHTLDLRRGGVWHYCLRMPGAPERRLGISSAPSGTRAIRARASVSPPRVA